MMEAVYTTTSSSSTVCCPPTEEQQQLRQSSSQEEAVVRAELDRESTSQNNKNKLLSSCLAHLDQMEYVYTIVAPASGTDDPGRSVVKAGIAGENGSYQLIMDIKEDPRNLVILYVMSQLKFPKARRLQLCEYLTRANYNLVLGNFELDMNDGEVRFKCSTVVGPEGLSNEVLHKMMPAAMGTMDRYFANMVKVSYGIMDPQEAAADVEVGPSPAGRPTVGEAMEQLAMLGCVVSATGCAVEEVDSTCATTALTDATACSQSHSNNSSGVDDVVLA